MCIRDSRIPTELPEDGIDGAVRAAASTVDDGREIAGSVDFGTGNFVLHLDGTYRDTDDYDIPGFAESQIFRDLEEAEEGGEEEEEEEEEAFGTLENSQTETSSFTAGASYIGERGFIGIAVHKFDSDCLLYTSPSPRDRTRSRMPSSA